MLNEKLKQVRKAKGLSQEQLAVKLNVVRQTISKWEKGFSVPDTEMLIKMAEVLDLNMNAFFNEIMDKNEVKKGSEYDVIIIGVDVYRVASLQLIPSF